MSVHGSVAIASVYTYLVEVDVHALKLEIRGAIVAIARSVTLIQMYN